MSFEVFCLIEGRIVCRYSAQEFSHIMEDKVTNPDEKSLAGILSHDEKVTEAPPPELAEQTGRSKAVALNIVQNPLTVRFANVHLFYLSYS
jgi:hypothetical protein